MAGHICYLELLKLQITAFAPTNINEQNVALCTAILVSIQTNQINIGERVEKVMLMVSERNLGL